MHLWIDVLNGLFEISHFSVETHHFKAQLDPQHFTVGPNLETVLNTRAKIKGTPQTHKIYYINGKLTFLVMNM